MFKSQLRMDRGVIEGNHEFYHACLDRTDILLTEKHSQVMKKQVLEILNALTYFKPKR